MRVRECHKHPASRPPKPLLCLAPWHPVLHARLPLTLSPPHPFIPSTPTRSTFPSLNPSPAHLPFSNHRCDRPQDHAKEMVELMKAEELAGYQGVVAVGGDGLFQVREARRRRRGGGSGEGQEWRGERRLG